MYTGIQKLVPEIPAEIARVAIRAAEQNE